MESKGRLRIKGDLNALNIDRPKPRCVAQRVTCPKCKEDRKERAFVYWWKGERRAAKSCSTCRAKLRRKRDLLRRQEDQRKVSGEQRLKGGRSSNIGHISVRFDSDTSDGARTRTKGFHNQ